MAKENQNQGNKGKGGGGDISGDTKFLPEFLAQALGNIATVLGQRGYKVEKVTELMQGMNAIIGEQGTIQAINALVAALHSSPILQTGAKTFGWSPSVVLLLREALDELFDGIKHEHLEHGKLSKGDATKALGKTIENLEARLEKQMSFEWAVQFLSTEEQLELMQRVNAFCTNLENTERWNFWRARLNKVALLTPLLHINVAQWDNHLKSLLGNPPSTASKKDSPLKKAGDLIMGVFTGNGDPEAEEALRGKVRRATAMLRASANNDDRTAKALSSIINRR